MVDMLDAALSGEPTEVDTPRVEDTPVAETAPETTDTPVATPERGPDGKFVKAATETPSEPAATAPKLLNEAETVGFYKAMQDERDKRQAAEKRIAELEGRLSSLKPTDEPEAPEQRIQAEIASLRSQNLRLEANLEHGKAKVQEAYDWAFKKCDEDKAFNARVAQQIQANGNPYEVAIALHREHSELEEFNAWKASKDAAPVETPPAVAEAPVPRSLATAPGNGGAGKPLVIIGADEPFNALFK